MSIRWQAFACYIYCNPGYAFCNTCDRQKINLHEESNLISICIKYFGTFTCALNQSINYFTEKRPFHLDLSITNPLDIFQREYIEFFIEQNMRHKGLPKSKKKL